MALRAVRTARDNEFVHVRASGVRALRQRTPDIRHAWNSHAVRTAARPPTNLPIPCLLLGGQPSLPSSVFVRFIAPCCPSSHPNRAGKHFRAPLLKQCLQSMTNEAPNQILGCRFQNMSTSTRRLGLSLVCISALALMIGLFFSLPHVIWSGPSDGSFVSGYVVIHLHFLLPIILCGAVGVFFLARPSRKPPKLPK